MRAGLILATAAALLVLVTGDVFAQSSPQEQGRTEFQRLCTRCHSEDTSMGSKRSVEDWEAVIDRMRSVGAEVNDKEMALIARYLAAQGSGAPAQPATPPLGGGPTLPSSQQGGNAISSGTVALLEGHGCLTCHRVGEQGSFLGPDLSDVGSLRTPEELQRALMNPDAEVQPAHRQVRIVTKAGETRQGRLLNQDGFSIQLTDGNGQLQSFLKEQLREFTILKSNLMPSYSNKLTEEQLRALIAALTGLKGGFETR